MTVQLAEEEKTEQIWRKREHVCLIQMWLVRFCLCLRVNRRKRTCSLGFWPLEGTTSLTVSFLLVTLVWGSNSKANGISVNATWCGLQLVTSQFPHQGGGRNQTTQHQAQHSCLCKHLVCVCVLCVCVCVCVCVCACACACACACVCVCVWKRESFPFRYDFILIRISTSAV